MWNGRAATVARRLWLKVKLLGIAQTKAAAARRGKESGRPAEIAAFLPRNASLIMIDCRRRDSLGSRQSAPAGIEVLAIGGLSCFVADHARDELLKTFSREVYPLVARVDVFARDNQAARRAWPNLFFSLSMETTFRARRFRQDPPKLNHHQPQATRPFSLVEHPKPKRSPNVNLF